MINTPIYIDENILYPPFTIDRCREFVTRANNNNKNVIQYEENRYAIADNEIMGEKEVEIDVPDYDEEGNPIIIEYEDTEVVVDYDEEGNIIGTHEITVTKHKQQTHKETITIPYPVINPNYEQEQAEKERERLNSLYLTKADFWIALLARGITKADVKAKVELIPDETLKAKTLIRIDDADHYWRGDASMDVLGAMFDLTSADLDYLFENKQLPERS